MSKRLEAEQKDDGMARVNGLKSVFATFGLRAVAYGASIFALGFGLNAKD